MPGLFNIFWCLLVVLSFWPIHLFRVCFWLMSAGSFSDFFSMWTYTVDGGIIGWGFLTDAWHAFCGDMDCRFNELFYSSSCTNHVAVISIDMFLLLMFLLSFTSKLSSSQMQRPSLFFRGLSPLQKSCTVINGCIVLLYLGLGIWKLGEQLRKTGGVMPLHKWLELLLQGLSWLGICPVIHIFPENPSKAFKWHRSALAVILGGFVSVSSVLEVARNRVVTVKTILDFLCLPGGIILLLCALKEFYVSRENGEFDNGSLYTPLDGESDVSTTNSCDCVAPFAEAGFLSRIFFWWLNPLMQKGYKKPLDDKDVPLLHAEDRAETCYNSYVEQLNKKKKVKHITSPSIYWALFYCHLRDILVTGFCALLKTLTLSSGPILLNMFIRFAEKEDDSRREGFVLAAVLFFIKFLESLSQRQWYFRSRKLGLQVRSQLSAAIYKKQFRMSNSGRMEHSSGEIMNYVTVDAYRIGEFPFWFHQTWTMSLQLCIAMAIMYNAVGAAAISALLVMLLTVLCNTPLAKLQHQFHAKLMGAQDMRLKAVSEALVNMKVLKLYAWENHFKKVIEGLREVEHKWLSASQLGKAYSTFVYWTALVLVSAASFTTCYLLKIPMYPSNVFTFVATIRLVQEPVRTIPDLIGVIIQAKVSLGRIVKYLDAPELHIHDVRRKHMDLSGHVISITSSNFSWEGNVLHPTLKNIDLKVKCKDKVAICGEVGSGKSSLLAAILGEIPSTQGKVEVRGKIAYVSQSAWIPTGTLQENIMFGSSMDKKRYRETLEKCSLVKDFDMLPFGDLTEIGERGVNLSGGQKQRLQLARALYQDADIYLLDDPFSAVDAHTAVSLFNDYVMGALSEKTVILVTHQVDFLPAFNFLLLMSKGRILYSAPFSELLVTSQELQDLVNAHKEVRISGGQEKYVYGTRNRSSTGEITHIYSDKLHKKIEGFEGNQLIKKEEKETGEMGLKPYLLYFNQNKGYLYFSLVTFFHIIFIAGLISQNSWLAANIQNPQTNQLRLITVYLILGFGVTVFLFARCMLIVILNLRTSKSLFHQLLDSLFHAPMSFFDSTPLGRILTRVSSDLSIVDLDVPFALMYSVCTMLNTCSSLGVLAFITWQVLAISVPMIYLTIRLQNYYLATGKELMRINGTTKSLIANHLAESVAGAITIRAFEEEERFIAKNFELIDKNASPVFHNSAASEWLILWLETMSAVVLSSSALVISLLPRKTFSSGFIGMALSYGLSLNMSLVFCIQSQCTLTNYIISVERLNQYMHIPSEAQEVIEGNRPPKQWPPVGVVEFQNLKIRYRTDSPLILKGISCTFEGGYKIGVVGRTGSGKTTLISALFRLVEPAGGKILIDGLDITTIGLHDLRSRLAIIPQEPTLFNGTVRYNLDPLGQHTDQDIWEVLKKCQLHEPVKDKDKGLDSLVIEDGSNWSLGQRQLFCLCRALLRRSRILVLDEATASIDNATDSILQKTIRSEFSESTVITVAHRIPTVMDCTMVLAISDGKLVEFDKPEKLMQCKESLFKKLVKEYWSYAALRQGSGFSPVN